jgi:MFS family permease
VTLLRLAGKRTFVSLRRHYNYRLFFAGQLTSVAGTWMQNIGLAWVVVQLAPHQKGLAVAILAICRFGPFTLLGLVAGAVADRFDNRRTVIVTQTVQMVFAALLAALALLGHLTLGEVYAIAFLTGIAVVFDAPARQNLTFQMVGRDELPNAIALNSSLFNTARIFGPALAGVIIAAAGSGWCFALNAISFLAVLAGLLAMRKNELFPLAGRERPTIWNGTREGFAYARRSPTVKVVLAMMVVFASICFNFNILLPVLAKQTLAAGPRTFGILSACFGCGALLGALASATLARTNWRIMFTGAAGFGACELLIAPLRSVAVVGVLLFVCGVFFTSYTANSNAAIQLDSPDYIRGRVLGLYYYAWNGLAPIGSILVGWLCDVGGTELAFAVAGFSALAATAAAAAAVKRPRPVDSIRMQPEVAADQLAPSLSSTS